MNFLYLFESFENYMALTKNPTGNLEELQRMVDAYAKVRGYNVGPVYRGDAGEKRGNVYDPYRTKDAYDNGPATLFTNNKKLADFYDEGRNARRFYIKLNNPLDSGENTSYKGRHWDAIGGYVVDGRYNNKDGVIVRDVSDGPGICGDIYGTFTSEQVKLADPITYDNSGEIIPLSQRFDDTSNDIRY